MAKDYSFDVVCRTDLQEAQNAVNQAAREIGTSKEAKALYPWKRDISH